MTRTLLGSFALGALTLLYPAAASAQTHVDVGVWTPGGGGRVVIGGGPVYYRHRHRSTTPSRSTTRRRLCMWLLGPYYRPYYRPYLPALLRGATAGVRGARLPARQWPS